MYEGDGLLQNGSCNIFSMFDVERFPSLEEMVVYYQHTPLHFNQLNKDVLLTHVLRTVDETIDSRIYSCLLLIVLQGIGLDDAEYCGTFEEGSNGLLLFLAG